MNGWTRLLMLVALCTAGCTDVDVNHNTDDDTDVCTARAILAMNPATGECEWTSDCDKPASWDICDDTFECESLPADACDFDARCERVTLEACPDCMPGSDCTCTRVDQCQTRTPDSCIGLDEYTCSSTPGCRPQYADGMGGAPMADPIDGGAGMPYYDPYQGCAPLDCNAMDEATCIADSACVAVYAATPCAAPMPGEDIACEDAFVSCEHRNPRPACDDLYDPYACDSAPGCSWIEEGSGEMPCECDPDTGDCACGGGLIAPGYCAADDTPPPPACGDVYDPSACEANPACDWYEDGATDLPCFSPDCDEKRSGYCGEAEPQPNGCYDYYDEYSCSSDPSCNWNPEGGADPMPCDCLPDDPACICAAPEPWGFCEPNTTPRSCYDHYDEYSCSADAGCAWTGPSDGGTEPMPMPCECDPSIDPDCPCGDGSGDRIAAWCVPVEEPPPAVCYDYYDLYSCTSTPGCEWVDDSGFDPMPCDCAPDDPNCACTMPAPIGYCQPTEKPATCSSYADVFSCGSDADCEWVESFAPMPPCECAPDDPACTCPTDDMCFGAWMDETGTCRAPNDGVYPSECCATLGFCQERGVEPQPEPEPTTPCTEVFDPATCDSTDGCYWDETAIPGDDPDGGNGLWMPGACLASDAP